MVQNGSIALHHACYSEKPNGEVVQLLVEAGSDVNALDEQGYSPLIVAAKKNQTEAIDFLRKHGADTTLKNSVRLRWSTRDGDGDLICALIRRVFGASLEKTRCTSQSSETTRMPSSYWGDNPRRPGKQPRT
jgi:ankyrin repeat protein